MCPVTMSCATLGSPKDCSMSGFPVLHSLPDRLLLMQETQVRSLGLEDPLEKAITTQSSILGFSWWLSW